MLVLSPVFQVRGGPFPSDPHLSVSLNGGQIALSWQDTNDWLQCEDRLSVFSWVNVLEPPVRAGGTNTITRLADQPSAFYRLVRSPSLPPPTRLAITPLADTNGNSYFNLNWDAVSNAVSYNLYMASVPGVNQSNYSSLPDGRVFLGITNLYAAVPDVPDMIFLPVLTQGMRYYFAVTAVSQSAAQSADSNEASEIFGDSGSVSGSVYTQLLFGTNVTDVLLPGVSLSFVNASNSAFSATATSDLQGHFSFPEQPAGTYQLCWQARGFISGCISVTISNESFELDPIQIYASSSNGFVYGQIAFENSAAIFHQDDFFQINVVPVVTLKNTNGDVLRGVRANGDGQYVMGDVPRATSLLLGLTVEGASVVSNINTFVTGQVDLILPNSPPTIHSIEATFNGQPIYRVVPGATVQVAVSASDPNSDPLAFQWFDSYGPVSYPSSSNISWTIPRDAVGFQYLFVRVSDGRGGYDTARLTLSANPFLFFSGQVIGSDTDAPLINAFVQLNNVVTNTDTNGFFSFELTETNEYDLTIAQNGYVSLAKVLYNETTGKQYRLLKISSYFSANCMNSFSQPTTVTNAEGVIVSLPPGALLDGNGNTYNGCVRVTMDTLDPCNPTNAFPGGNFTTDGSVLDTFGLVEVNVWDFSGNPLHLNPAFSAELFVPIGSTCFDPGNLPSAAQFFTLDLGSSRWIAITNGTRATNLVGSTTKIGFAGSVAILGLLAMAEAVPTVTDLKFVVDASLHIPLTVGFFKDKGGKPDHAKQIGKYEDIYNDGDVIKKVEVPADKIIWAEVLNLLQSPGDYYVPGSAKPLTDRQKDVIQVLKVTNPGAAVTVTLGLGVNVDVPRSAQLKALTAKAVAKLKGNFLVGISADEGFKPVKDYYDKIDPKGLKRDFKSWQIENGWNTNKTGFGNGDDTAYAMYFNANELGAGRRMGMKVFKDRDQKDSVAYYVATYASLKDAEEDEVAKRQPGDPKSKLKYIVCMEYSLPLDGSYLAEATKPANANRYIKFYAYSNQANASPPITGTVPDEARDHPLPVPYLCMVCHGAGTTELGEKNKFGDVHGQFVVFDRANYTFSQAKNFTYADLTPTFKKLNENLVVVQKPKKPTPNLENLINAIKNNGYTTDTSALPKWGATPPTPAQLELHNKIYAVSCRSCHSTQTLETGRANWGTADGFSGKKPTAYAGNPTHDEGGAGPMPQAQRTYSIFWGSANAKKLHDAGIVDQPTVLSQPAILSGGMNKDYFP